MRIKCLVLCFVVFLAVAFGNISKNIFVQVYADPAPAEIDEPVSGDCESVADFIEEYTNKFVLRFNQDMNEENEEWNATSVENRFSITVDECGEIYDGVFIDFDGSNGYAVIGNNYDILDFVTYGDSPYINIEADEYYFSSTCGYFYFSEECNDYLSVYPSNNADENFVHQEIFTKTYAGQESGYKGCGAIIDTYAYVQDKYGNGWSLGNNYSFSMVGFDMDYLSCYSENSIVNNSVHNNGGEGNCWIVSAYHVLQWLADSNRFTRMPSSLSYLLYYPNSREPAIYSRYFDKQGNNLSPKLYYNNGNNFVYKYELKNLSFYFPNLYARVRNHVNSQYGRVNSGSIWNSSEIIESVAGNYGYNVDAVEHVFWGAYANRATSKLDDDIPLLWSTLSGTYGSHTMAVCGYKYYEKETGWWIFKHKEYKLFYELRDGWWTAPRYYDVSGHCGPSAIVSLNFY